MFLTKVIFVAALEYSRQRINTNTDFLLHEGGVPQNAPKRDYVASNSFTQTAYNNGGKRDYAAEFPALGPPVTPKSTSTTAFNNINSGQQHHTQQPNGKRDYVAPQLPSTKPVQNNQPVTQKTSTIANNNVWQRNPQSSNGKRDYVAPQFPTLKPVQNNQPAHNNQPMQNNQPAGGNVRDLVNFYENKGPNQGPPSYSSIAKGPINNNGPTSTRFRQPTPTSAPHTPTKPMSFSSIVSGGNKPGAGTTQILTTARPTTRVPSTPGTRPGSPALPSSIVNNNRGTTTSNGNTVTDAELQVLSEELLRKDSNNAARYVTTNYQERSSSQPNEDKAPLP